MVIQQGTCLADIGYIVGYFANTGRFDGHIGRLAQFFANEVGHIYQAVALPESQIDGVVGYLTINQTFQTAKDTINAVIHVREVKHFILAVDSDGTAVIDFEDEVRDDPQHTFNIIIITAVDITETEHQIFQELLESWVRKG